MAVMTNTKQMKIRQSQHITSSLNSVEHQPEWNPDSCFSGQEILCFICNPKVHYDIHRGSPHWSLFWARLIRCISSLSICIRSVLILPFHLLPWLQQFSYISILVHLVIVSHETPLNQDYINKLYYDRINWLFILYFISWKQTNNADSYSYNIS